MTNARATRWPSWCQAPAEQAIAENALNGSSLRSLFAVVENYPDLKAKSQNVLSLQEELTTTENQISFSRQHYNATVLDYNTNIQTFPGPDRGHVRVPEARVLRRRTARPTPYLPTT